jgi:hypothetical protein
MAAEAGGPMGAVQQHNAALEQALNAEGNGPSGGAPPPGQPPPQQAQPPPPQVPDDSAQILELAKHAQELRAQQGLPPDNVAPPPPPPTPPMSERIINEIKARLAALRGH